MSSLRDRQFGLIDYLLILFGLSVMGLGSAVMYAWVYQIDSLIQIHPTFPPMMFNTALGLAICGISICLLVMEYKKLSALLAIAVILLASSELAQWLTGSNLHLDEVFYHYTLPVPVRYPGRMSPASSISFLFSGISLLLLSFRSISPALMWVAGFMAAIVLGIALTITHGYVAHLEQPSQWKDLTRMALHTAIGFLLVSGSLLIYSTYLFRQRHHTASPLWLSTLFSIILCVISIGLGRLVEFQETVQIKHIIRSETDALRDFFTDELEDQVREVERTHIRWQMRGGIPLNELAIDVNNYFKNQEGMVGVLRITSDQTIDFSDFAFPWRLSDVQSEIQEQLKALKEGRLQITAEENTTLISLDVDRKGLIIWYPLMSGERNDGYLLGLVDITVLTESVLPRTYGDLLAYEIRYKNKVVYSKNVADDYFKVNYEVTRSSNIQNVEWTFSCWPTQEFIFEKRSVMSFIIFVFGTLLSLFAGGLIYALLRLRTRITELESSNQAKRALLQHICQETRLPLQDLREAAMSMERGIHPDLQARLNKKINHSQQLLSQIFDDFADITKIERNS